MRHRHQITGAAVWAAGAATTSGLRPAKEHSGNRLSTEPSGCPPPSQRSRAQERRFVPSAPRTTAEGMEAGTVTMAGETTTSVAMRARAATTTEATAAASTRTEEATKGATTPANVRVSPSDGRKEWPGCSPAPPRPRNLLPCGRYRARCTSYCCRPCRRAPTDCVSTAPPPAHGKIYLCPACCFRATGGSAML